LQVRREPGEFLIGPRAAVAYPSWLLVRSAGSRLAGILRGIQRSFRWIVNGQSSPPRVVVKPGQSEGNVQG
jgi:hypothetical protein